MEKQKGKNKNNTTNNNFENKIKIAQKFLTEFEDKYFNLVWYARAGNNRKMKVVREKMSEVEKKFPNEIENLNEDETNWENGFNSGMMACTRFFSGILNDLDEELVKQVFEDEETGKIPDLKCDCNISKDGEITHTNENCKLKFQIQQSLNEFPNLDT